MLCALDMPGLQVCNTIPTQKIGKEYIYDLGQLAVVCRLNTQLKKKTCNNWVSDLILFPVLWPYRAFLERNLDSTFASLWASFPWRQFSFRGYQNSGNELVPLAYALRACNP